MSNDTYSAHAQGNSGSNLHIPKKRAAKEYGKSRVIFVLIIAILTACTFFASFIFHQYASTIDGAALSFLTSLIFTFIYVFIVEDDMREAQKEEREGETQQLVKTVEKEIDTSLQSMLGPMLKPLIGDIPVSVASHWQTLLPIHYFPPTDDPLQEFGERLSSNMTRCRSYIFRGGTGQRCAKLLDMRNDSSLDCKILILDPRDDTAIEVHAQDRDRANPNGQSGKKTLDEIKKEILGEITQTITDLYGLDKPFQIHVRTCTDKLFYRSEIFPEEVIVSFLTSDRTKHYPAAHIYASNSFYYGAIWKDFLQSWSHGNYEFLIRPNSTTTDRDNTLKELGLLA